MAEKILVHRFNGPESMPSAYLGGIWVGDMLLRSLNRDEDGEELDLFYVWRVGDVIVFQEVSEYADSVELHQMGQQAHDQMVAEIRKQFPDHELEFDDLEETD